MEPLMKIKTSSTIVNVNKLRCFIICGHFLKLIAESQAECPSRGLKTV